ncbi:MAG TPA: sigma-70 factor domain-containing protein, partial [Thermodesulfobacteriota bacterium]|nr:sigma-70 factor domain-containing protein [Thermodesulfobacteriota bacterium]
MQVICSWCENFMREKVPFNDASKSHGICKECYKKVADETQGFTRKYRKGKEGILQNKNRGVKTETNGEPPSLTDNGFQSLPEAEGGISLSLQNQDDPMDDEEETEAEFANGGGRREEDKQRGRSRYEEFRSLNIYIKEITRERLLSPQEEIEISTEIKKCEAKAKRIRSLLLKLSNGKVSA